jgi:hypothetical protein
VAPRIAVGTDESFAWGGTARGELTAPPGCGPAISVEVAGWLFGKFDTDGGACWFGAATCEGGMDDLALDPATGDLFAIGRAAASCDVFTAGATPTPVSVSGSGSLVVARFSSAGAVSWAYGLDELPAAGRSRLAFSEGQLYVAAPFSGTVLGSQFDGGVTSLDASVDLLVFQLDPATGAVRSDAGFQQFGGSGTEELSGFSASADGGLWIAAHSVSAEGLSLGGAVLPTDGGVDLFVGQLDLSLGHRYSRPIRGDGPSTVSGFRARGPTPALLGELHGKLNLGANEVESAPVGTHSYVGAISLP